MYTCVEVCACGVEVYACGVEVCACGGEVCACGVEVTCGIAVWGVYVAWRSVHAVWCGGNVLVE